MARSTNLLVLATGLLLIFGQTAHVPAATQVAIGAAILATLAQWRTVPVMARIFVVAALVLGPAVALWFPRRIGELHAALIQGVAFAVLLSTIGVLRHAVRHSAIAQRAARFLVSVPRRGRYAAVNVGSHFLSLLFNVGIIALIGELLGSGDKARMPKRQRQELLLAGMRGTVLMTIWSPMGLGFAIVTTGIDRLDPVRFLVLSFLSAILLLALTCFVFGRSDDGSEDRSADGAPQSSKPVWAILAVSAALLAATILLHEFQGMSFILATAAVIPLFSIVWVMFEPATEPKPLVVHLAGMFRGLTDMRGESAIFLSANVIGAAISICVREQAFWGAVQNGTYPDLAIIGLCLLIVPLAGALMIPHSIFVVLLVQLFGHGTTGAGHPMTLALALTLGWAMAIAVSPISAMSLITGSLTGVSSHVVGLSWNARFALLLLVCSSLLVAGAYALGL
ncbi:hypothetical protein EYW49_16115 [Siculibacillus lacustris]|uniref:DUF401 family protein n=1 Tax=Siculibacillus lacustris TaxID=1549641 RepID=A0A4Q9VL94_9HYPH|nr:hypothetical protein [Siculibacillus lacustris]TBW35344.1 hypothetical protein EYW49_16115 [Siculibacillus lacustris]